MRTRSHERLGTLACLLVAGWTVFAVYSVHAGMPETAIQLPFEDRNFIRTFTPQGWAFFTRDPREERFSVYGNDDDAWRPLLAMPLASAENMFGLSRVGRANAVEYGMLYADIPAETWTECRGSHAACLDQLQTSATLDNAAPVPAICGDVGVVVQPPVPWVWSRNERIEMPLRAVRVRVRCRT